MDEKKKPWDTYIEMKEELPLPEVIISFIEELARKNLQVGAIVSTIFLTNSRICEVVRYKDKVSGLEREGVRCKDIRIDEEGFLHIKTRVEKARKQRLKFKEAVLPCDARYYLYPLMQILKKWIEENFNVEDELSDKPIFRCSDSFVREKLAREGITPHVLRNIRSKYLVIYEKFTVEDLMDFTQWVNPELAIQYSKSSQQLIKKKMLESLKK